MKPKIKRVIIPIAIAIAVWLILNLVARVVGEILWFKEVGYLPMLRQRWLIKILLLSTTSIFCGVFLGLNLSWANDRKWRWFNNRKWIKTSTAYLERDKLVVNPGSTSKMFGNLDYRDKIVRDSVIKLPLLLSIAISSSIAIALLVICYGSLALEESNIKLNFSLNAIEVRNFLQNIDNIIPSLYLLVLIGIITVSLLLYTRISLFLCAIAIAIFISIIITDKWALILACFHRTEFYYSDPQFNKDIGFYFFNLPILNLLCLCFNGLFGYGLISIFLTYLLSGNSLSEGKFPGFSSLQVRHISILGGIVILNMAFHHWLNRFQLLYSKQGVVYGGAYTDIKIQLPLENMAMFIAIILAMWLFLKSYTGYKQPRIKFFNLRKNILGSLPVIFYVLFLIIGFGLSNAVQRFLVQPNELVTETPYLKRSIKLTRRAFGLEDIEVKTFNPKGTLTKQDIAKNNLTIENIRLWDTRPILQTNRQLQQIRLYYSFPDADIDRYIFQQEDNTKDKQQVIIAARELDYNSVPDRAKTWVNEHLVYTHGYGFTVSPVNKVDRGGLPFYYVKNIGTDKTSTGNLEVSSQFIRNSIPLNNPRIYYGELTNSYIMTSTKARELDFPSGDENVYNSYDGMGGIPLNNYVLRFLFAQYLQDWQMLFTRNFTPDTKLLKDRNIIKRVTKIAPWLTYDRDPYLVVANTNEGRNGNLYWILDGYTKSDRYPYSDPGENDFNYIRNSVKVVIDAYNGNVDFYLADPKDPIITTWNKAFPNFFKPLESMPTTLLSHIRYPEDLFSIQSERLLTYHMIDPQVFYNQEDRWEIPQEIYDAESQSVKPYYLIMKLPTAEKEEFILLHPYTPTSRPNLTAWLAARSDNKEYGKLLLYKFPKQRLIFGPDQIEALINQDPTISQQISLWSREGSHAIQGNLLIIPIEDSLLYVEPLYIEAETNSLPTLARVIVVYENEIVMAETLDRAIDTIFNQ